MRLFLSLDETLCSVKELIPLSLGSRISLRVWRRAGCAATQFSLRLQDQLEERQSTGTGSGSRSHNKLLLLVEQTSVTRHDGSDETMQSLVGAHISRQVEPPLCSCCTVESDSFFGSSPKSLGVHSLLSVNSIGSKQAQGSPTSIGPPSFPPPSLAVRDSPTISYGDGGGSIGGNSSTGIT